MSLESLPSNISEHLSQINSQTNVNELIQTSSCDQDVECNLPLSIKPEKYFTQKTVKSNNKGADVKRQTFFRNKAELFLSDNEISDTLVPPKVHAPHHSIQKNFHFIQNPGDQDTQNHLVDQKEHNYDYHNFLLNRMDHLSIDLPLHSSIESEETIAEPVRMVQTQKNAVIKREIEKSHQRTMSYKDNFNRSKERKLQVFKAKGSPHSEHIFIDNPYIEIDLSSQANNNYQPCGDRAENLPTFATYSSVEEEYTLKTSHDSFPLSNVYAKENKIPSAKKSIQVQASENNLNSLDQSDKENKNFNLNTKHKTLQNSKKIGKTIKSQQPHYLNPKTARKKKNQEEQSFQTPCLEKGQSLIQTDEKLKPVTPAKEINNPKQVTIDFSHPSPFSPINVMSDKIEVSPKTIPLMNVKDCPKIYGPQAKRPESDCVIENACILGNIIQSNKAMMDYPKVTIKLSDNNDDAASLAVAAQTQSAKNSQKIRDLLTKRNEHILRKIIGKANIDYPFPVYNHQHPHHNLSVEFVENISQPKEAQLKGETINVSHLSERCISEPNGFYIKKGGAEVESDYITKSFDDHRCVEPKSKSFIKIENNIQPQLLRRNQSDPKLRQPTTTS